MRTHVVSALLIFALAGAVMPGMVLAAEAAPGSAAKLARDDPNRVVCRRLDVTGSLVQTGKICKTNAEWKAQARDTQDEATQMQQRGLINSCGSSEPGKC
jgi:hypothetical protein